MVCVSIAHEVTAATVYHRRDPVSYRVCRDALEGALAGHWLLVGQFVAFDLVMWGNEWPDLLPLIFACYDTDRVTDTNLRQKLIDIGKGIYVKGHGDEDGHAGFTLKELAALHGYPVDLDKDTWRLRYSEFDNVPVKDWPAGAREYSEHDAKAPLQVALCQEADAERYLDDEFRQARADLALWLTSAWGIHTDPVMVARYRRETEAKARSYETSLLAAGLIYKDQGGKWHKKAKVAAEYAGRAWGEWSQVNGLEPPKEARTGPEEAPNGYSLNKDALTLLGNELLLEYQQFGSATGRIAKVVEWEQGIEKPIHTRFDSLKVTGRTGSSKPPTQNRDKKNGDRECIAARDGYVLLNADVPGLELRSHVQCMTYLGIRSRMLDVLNAPVLNDPHSYVAADLLGISLEEAHRRKDDPEDKVYDYARQTGKVTNFGLPGGLGALRFVKQARSQYGISLTIPRAKELIATWHRTWPEMRQYFNYINSLCGGGRGRADVIHFVSNRRRGKIPYTEACNTFFQGLGADAAKEATYELVKACYTGTGWLRGCRMINFIHDEWLLEVPDDSRLQERSDEMQAIIARVLKKWFPDVPVIAKPMAVRRWSKSAKKVTGPDGRIVPWEWSEAIKEYERLGIKPPYAT